MSLLNCFYFKTEGLEYCLVLVVLQAHYFDQQTLAIRSIGRHWRFVAFSNLHDNGAWREAGQDPAKGHLIWKFTAFASQA